MFIKKIELTNFKNLRNFKAEFGRINIIQANNGSGKSSIVDAINYMLTDSTRENLGEYVTRGEKSFNIVSEFEYIGKNYEYDIFYSGSTKKLLKCGEDIYNQSEATKYLHGIIHPNLLTYSTFSEQGESYSILKETPQNRLSKVKSILGMDIISQIVNDIREDTKIVKGKIDVIKAEISLLENAKFNLQEIPELPDIDETKRLMELEEKKKLLHEKIESEKREYSLKIAAFDSYTKGKTEAEDKIRKLKKEIEETEPGEKPEKPAFDRTKDDIVKEIADIEADVRGLKKQLDLAKQGKCPTCGKDYKTDPLEIEKLISENYENIKTLNVIKEDIDAKERAYQSKLSAYNISVSKIESKKENLEEAEKNLEKILLNHIVCPAPVQIEESGYDRNVYDSLKKEINVYEQKVLEVKRITESNERVKEEERLNKEYIGKKKEELDGLYYREGILRDSGNLLNKDFSAFLIENATQYIQSKMNEFFQKSYGRYSIYFQQNDKKNTVDFFYSDKDNIMAPAGMASGFEKQLLSMSFRIALGSITNLGLYVFDEIDSDSSAENSIKLFDTFLQEKDIYTQVFLITHHSDTVSYIENNFEGVRVFNMDGAGAAFTPELIRRRKRK